MDIRIDLKVDYVPGGEGSIKSCHPRNPGANVTLSGPARVSVKGSHRPLTSHVVKFYIAIYTEQIKKVTLMTEKQWPFILLSNFLFPKYVLLQDAKSIKSQKSGCVLPESANSCNS